MYEGDKKGYHTFGISIYITLVCVNDAVSSLVVFFVKQSNMVAQWKRQLPFYRWAMELGITS